MTMEAVDTPLASYEYNDDLYWKTEEEGPLEKSRNVETTTLNWFIKSFKESARTSVATIPGEIIFNENKVETVIFVL